MKLTKYGHSCVLLDDGQTKILFDPGVFSELPEIFVDAIIITHIHPDHLDAEKIKKLVLKNPTLKIFGNTSIKDELAKNGLEVEVVEQGIEFSINSISLKAIGNDHAVIHPDLPIAQNTGFILNDNIFHPGDSFTITPSHINVLLLPVVAPWSKISETVDYISAMKSEIVVPIHDGFLREGGVFHRLSQQWCEKYNTKFLEVEIGKEYEI